MTIRIRRREFITFLSGAATASLSARAQQSAVPVIGFLSAGAPGPFAEMSAAFSRSLSDAGFVAGHNIAIEYRWAEDQYDRLPVLAADLVRRQVAVLVAVGSPAAPAAKAATA